MLVRTVVLVLAFMLNAAAAAAPRDAMVVSTAWLAEHLEAPGLVVLHVGSDDSYAQHIPGARLVRTADIAVTSEAGTLEMLPEAELRLRLAGLGIGDRSRIVVYYAETPPPATRVVFTLDAAGLGARTSLLDGGLPAWRRENRPLTADGPTGHIGDLSPLNMKRGVIVDADVLREAAGKPGTVIIDARQPEFYSGAKPGVVNNRTHKLGHVPGARNLPATTLVDENMNLAAPESLKAAFDRVGVKPNDKLIVYCHIGQQATAIIFAARSLGYDAVLYDGSFEDWSMRELPVKQ